MARREFFCGTIVDEFLVEKALHGPALSPDITQGMPRRDQFGVVLVELVLESPERPRPCKDWVRCRPASRSLTPSAKSAMS